jgi:hypothetical protein
MYSQMNTRQDISSNTPDYEEAQEEELPADRFCVWDEMNNCPWKQNKTGKDNEDGSDYDNACSGPRKRAKEGNHHLPQVSTGSDTTALSQHESEVEYGGISDGEGDRWCGVEEHTYMAHATVNAPTIHMQSRTHLQETCNWNSTYKRYAIGIRPTRQMQSELHLHNNAIRIAPTTSKCTRTRLIQLWTKPTRQMQLGTHPPIIECVVGPKGACHTASTSTAGRLRAGYYGQI